MLFNTDGVHCCASVWTQIDNILTDLVDHL